MSGHLIVGERLADSSAKFAALTIASTASFVMSPAPTTILAEDPTAIASRHADHTRGFGVNVADTGVKYTSVRLSNPESAPISSQARPSAGTEMPAGIGSLPKALSSDSGDCSHDRELARLPSTTVWVPLLD